MSREGRTPDYGQAREIIVRHGFDPELLTVGERYELAERLEAGARPERRRRVGDRADARASSR